MPGMEIMMKNIRKLVTVALTLSLTLSLDQRILQMAA